MSAAVLPSPAELERALGSTPGARRSWWRIIGSLAAVTAAALALTCACRGSGHQVQYESVPVARGDLCVTVRSTGTLQAVTSVEVGSEVSGRVLQVLVDVNDEVHQGQVLARIEPEAFGSMLEQASAQHAGALAAISLAEATARESARILRRNRELVEEEILPQADLDACLSTKERADASLQSAQAAARAAEAALALAASSLRKTTIRAPIDGVVLARLVEPGQTVTAGYQTPVLFKLAQDLRKMRLDVDIDEADASRIHGGQSADFTVESHPGRTFPSKVVSLQMEPKVSQNVVTYQAVLAAANPELALFPGMTATAIIQTETRRGVLVVPNAALRFTPPAKAPGLAREAGNVQDGKHRVWVLGNGKPEPIEVKPGATDGRLTEILDGSLQEGMPVLTDAKEPS